VKATYRLALRLFTLTALAVALTPRSSGTAARQGRAAGEPEAVSLLGTPLYRTPAVGDALAKLENGLKDAAKKCETDPENPGNPDKAYETFRKIVGTRYWPAFGFIAAEAELHRSGR
jgi:hypothetical protein